MSSERVIEDHEVTADTDLYCLECGYNLRGLEGDPRRCPECWHLNPVGDLVIPAGEIRRRIRWMESWPVTCVATIAFLPCAWLMAIASNPVCVAFVALAGPLIWLCSVAQFAASCGKRRGWGWALARYHLFGLCTLWTVAGLWLAWVALLWYLLGASAAHLSDWWSLGSVAMIALLIVAFRRPIRWAYRQARRDFDDLQRSTAIDIIRTDYRHRLAGPDRNPKAPGEPSGR